MSNYILYDATAHAVHSVTVFQVNRADLNRRIKLDLKKGQNEVEIKNLPTVLDQDSIRVDGIGSAVIFDVIYRPPPTVDALAEFEGDEDLKNLKQQVADLDEELAILQKQTDVLKDYSGSMNSEHASSTQLSEFLDVYATRQRSITKEKVELTRKKDKLTKDITAHEKQKQRDAESLKRGVKIVVVVLADQDGPAELSLSYGVTNASWTPLYDLRAFIGSEDNKSGPSSSSNIELHYRASIQQATGEDWSDVHLTLSTASPQIGSAIPKLRVQRLNEDTGFVARTYSRGGTRARKSAVSFSKREKDSYDPTIEDSYLDEYSTLASSAPAFFGRSQATTTDHGQGFSSTFAIEGLSTIPSDTDKSSESHKVTIAVVGLDSVALQWITVPREVLSVFLECRVKNTSAYTFLPGESNVFMNNNFVSKSTIPIVSPQESFSCSLGVDPSVRVTYGSPSKKVNTPIGGLLSKVTVTTSHSQRISIKNTRVFPIDKLIVKDQVPVSSDARIKVNLLEPGLPDRGEKTASISATNNALKEVPVPNVKGGTVRARWAPANDDSDTLEANSEGLVEWICKMDASSSLDLVLNWEVNVPKGLKWK